MLQSGRPGRKVLLISNSISRARFRARATVKKAAGQGGGEFDAPAESRTQIPLTPPAPRRDETFRRGEAPAVQSIYAAHAWMDESDIKGGDIIIVTHDGEDETYTVQSVTRQRKKVYHLTLTKVRRN